MQLPAPTAGGTFEQVPVGTHLGVCYRFIDLGTQETNYGPKRKVMISWEIPEELMTEGDFAGRPFSFHQRYTWSTHEKSTLRQHLEAWRGRPFEESDFGDGRFDIRKIIGTGCLLTLVRNDKYTNLSSIGKVMKGMEVPSLVNDEVYFSLEPELFDVNVFDSFSDRLKETIASSPEYQAITNPHVDEPGPPSVDASEAFVGDEIPF